MADGGGGDILSKNALVRSKYFRASEARLTDATLTRTLDALAAGRAGILALDVEFYSALVEASTTYVVGSRSPFVLPDGAGVANFMREVGGHLLVKAGSAWAYCGNFHLTLPPPAGLDVAHVPAQTATVGGSTHMFLASIDERLVARAEAAGDDGGEDVAAAARMVSSLCGALRDMAYYAKLLPQHRRRLEELQRRCDTAPNHADVVACGKLVAALARDSSFHLFDAVLDADQRQLKTSAARAYHDDDVVRNSSTRSRAILGGLVDLTDACKLVTKEHCDVDSLHNTCALLGVPRPSQVSLFDVAIGNAIGRQLCGSAKLGVMYGCMASEYASCRELRGLFPLGKEHNPETDAFMALQLAIVFTQSLSWALARRARQETSALPPPAVRA